MVRQKTLKNVVKATGIGIHSGEKVRLTLRPAPENAGIVFRRVDLSPVVEIPVGVDHLEENRSLSTMLKKDGVCVTTVEHLLSAFSGVGIDNAWVDLDASEVPIMDGSSAPFVFLIQSAGIEEQKAPKTFIRIKQPIAVTLSDKSASLEPYHGFKLNIRLLFDRFFLDLSNKHFTLDFSMMSYVKEIARARTFGFLSDYEYIRQNNLGKGVSLDNTIVLGEDRVLNENGLRYPNELIRHKTLDSIGDLYVLGYSLLGCYSAYKPSHALNACLLKQLWRSKDAWEKVTFSDAAALPFGFFTSEQVFDGALG